MQRERESYLCLCLTMQVFHPARFASGGQVEFPIKSALAPWSNNFLYFGIFGVTGHFLTSCGNLFGCHVISSSSANAPYITVLHLQGTMQYFYDRSKTCGSYRSS